MCQLCLQTVAIALIGLTSSTGLVALAMTTRESVNHGAPETACHEKPGDGGSHAQNEAH